MAVNLLGAVADVLIAAALFYFLHSSRTGFKKWVVWFQHSSALAKSSRVSRSDNMISKLV